VVVRVRSSGISSLRLSARSRSASAAFAALAVAAGAMVVTYGVGCGAPAAGVSAVDKVSVSASSVEPSAGSASETASGASSASSLGSSLRTAETPRETRADEPRGRCPKSMVEIAGLALTDGRSARGGARGFCVDRYEASVMDLLPSGEERLHSPFEAVAGLKVRAVSLPDVYPQGYISAVEAQAACSASGKRLCRVAEWKAACRGPEVRRWGYGDRREPGRCNDRGRNPVMALHGRVPLNWRTMNEPQLNQLDGTLARTGSSTGCTNAYGVFDMVGNLHEWVADDAGTFYGGYYQDVSSVGHGEGCGYQTTAHVARYHDYSTGFRCCADLAGSAPEPPAAPASRKPRARR